MGSVSLVEEKSTMSLRSIFRERIIDSNITVTNERTSTGRGLKLEKFPSLTQDCTNFGCVTDRGATISYLRTTY